MTNFMKKLVVAVLVIAMCLSAFAGCAGKGAKDVFIIGGGGPTTGDYASYGISVGNGAQIAVDEINAAGGINGYQIDFRMNDTEASSENAVNIVNQLLDDGMCAYVGSTFSGESIASAAIANDAGIVQMTPSGSDAGCTELPYAFRTCFTDPLQGKALAELVASDFSEIKTIGAFFNAADTYSTGVFNAFKANSTANIVEASFTTEQNTDFSTQITKFKAENVDAIFMPIYKPEAVKFLDQARKAGLDVQVFGSDGLDGIHEEDGVNAEDIEGIIYLSGFVPTAPAANVQSFVKAYVAKYPSIPVDQFAANAYDTVYAFKAAMEKADLTPDMSQEEIGAAMKEAITQITVDGVTGKITWDASGEPVKEAFYIQISGGQPEVR